MERFWSKVEKSQITVDLPLGEIPPGMMLIRCQRCRCYEIIPRYCLNHGDQKIFCSNHQPGNHQSGSHYPKETQARKHGRPSGNGNV